jgi:hypothetical protein
MLGWVYLDILKAEHQIRLRQAEEARVWAQANATRPSHSVLKSLLLLLGRL